MIWKFCVPHKHYATKIKWEQQQYEHDEKCFVWEKKIISFAKFMAISKIHSFCEKCSKMPKCDGRYSLFYSLSFPSFSFVVLRCESIPGWIDWGISLVWTTIDWSQCSILHTLFAHFRVSAFSKLKEPFFAFYCVKFYLNALRVVNCL